MQTISAQQRRQTNGGSLAIGHLDELTSRMIVSGLLAPATRHQSQKRPPAWSTSAAGTDLAEQPLTWDRRAVIAAVRSVLIDRSAVLNALESIQAPTLVVLGKEDRTRPSIHSRDVVAKLPGA